MFKTQIGVIKKNSELIKTLTVTVSQTATLTAS